MDEHPGRMASYVVEMSVLGKAEGDSSSLPNKARVPGCCRRVSLEDRSVQEKRKTRAGGARCRETATRTRGHSGLRAQNTRP